MNYLYLFYTIIAIYLLYSPSLARRTTHTISSQVAHSRDLLTQKMVYSTHEYVISDDRLPRKLRRAGYSVGIIMRKPFLIYNDTTKTYDTPITDPFEEKFDPYGFSGSAFQPICPSENTSPGKIFENVNAFCTGHLVAPNIMITAGHCLNMESCENIAVIMDWKHTEHYIASDGKKRTKEPISSVYWCKNATHEYHFNPATSNSVNSFTSLTDYAIIQLDRDVSQDFPFVEIQPPKQRGENLNVGLKNLKIASFGHPAGLTEMFNPDAKVMKTLPHGLNFKATIDGEPGSSGGLVVNRASGKAVGITVRGNTAWKFRSESGTTPGGQRYSGCWTRLVDDCSDGPNGDVDRPHPDESLKIWCDPDKYSLASSVRQYYSHLQKLDPLPMFFFQTLAFGTEQQESCRTKALEKLLGYSNATGVWDNALKAFILQKMQSYSRPDGKSVLFDPEIYFEGQSALNYDGYSFPSPVLSTILCEFSKGNNGEYTPKFACEEPYQSGSVLLIRELLRNGFDGYSDVSLEGETIDTSLVEAINRFKQERGFPSEYQDITLSLYRHLLNVENNDCRPLFPISETFVWV